MARRLAQRGWTIHHTNWRCSSGEIDIVAQDGDCLVVVEVRTRMGARMGTPEDSVGAAKRSRLARLATRYCYETGWTGPCRVDVVAVAVGPDGRPTRVTHYRNAVSGAWA